MSGGGGTDLLRCKQKTRLRSSLHWPGKIGGAAGLAQTSACPSYSVLPRRAPLFASDYSLDLSIAKSELLGRTIAAPTERSSTA